MFECEYPHEQIHVYKNVFTYKNEIVDLIEKIDKSDNIIFPKWSTWFPSGAENQENLAFGYQKRMSDHISFKNNTEENFLYWLIFDAIVARSNDYANKHKIDIGRLAPLSISKYKPGASMGKHTDSNGLEGPETVSVVCYLNDDYVGGELKFENQGVTIKPEAGSIVIFPSKPPFFHQSMPVKSGWKYITPGFWSNIK